MAAARPRTIEFAGRQSYGIPGSGQTILRLVEPEPPVKLLLRDIEYLVLAVCSDQSGNRQEHMVARRGHRWPAVDWPAAGGSLSPTTHPASRWTLSRKCDAAGEVPRSAQVESKWRNRR